VLNRGEVKRTTMSAGVSFSKYHGLGNDFVLVDNRHSDEPCLTPEQAVEWCDRNFGIGADGVIFALPAQNPDSDYAMRIYNSDGSEPEMCGNGIRCLARFVADEDDVKEPVTYKVDTLAGLIVPEMLSDGQVKVDMGEPIFTPGDVPTTLAPTQTVTAGGKEDPAVVQASLEVAGKSWSVTTVSMGNPHALIYAADGEVLTDVNGLDLAAIGPLFENNAAFPARTNTEFIEILGPAHLRMRVWERGAGATLACGTGACATVVAGILEGHLPDRTPCVVDLPGGPLVIEWSAENNHVYMTGPAERVFSGRS